MNLLQVSIICALTSTLVMGMLVYFAQTKRRTNQAFLLLSLVLTAWLSTLFIASMVNTESGVMFWIRQTSAVSALIPLAMFYLRMAIANSASPNRKIRLTINLAWLVLYGTVFYVCQTRLFLVSVSMPESKFEIPEPNYGPGFVVFMIYLVFAWAVLVWSFIRDLKRTTGIRKTELQLVLLGCICGLFLGITLLVVSNVFTLIELSQLIPISVIVLHSFIAYGVATKSILDIPNVIRRLVASMLLFVYLGFLYFAAWLAGDYLLQFLPRLKLPLDHFFAAIVVAFAMTPAHGWMQRITKHLFVKSPPLDVGKTIQEANRLLNTIATVDELLNQFTVLISKKLQNEHLRIYLWDEHVFRLVCERNYTAAENTLDPNDPLVQAISGYEEPLVLEMIQRMRTSDILQAAERRMRETNTEAIFGMRIKSKLIGVLLLGPRASARIYGAMEVAVLSGLGDQLAISIENAKLYTEVQNSRIYNDILLDRLVGGVIAVNGARMVTVFNREAQRITGLSHEQVVNHHMQALPEALREGLEQAFDHGGCRDLEAVVKVGQTEVPVRLGSTVFHGHTGNVLGALLVFTDQTEMKKLEYQIRRTDRLASLGTLAAGMAHEIKNPLVSLKTFSQLMPERYDDPDFRQTFSVLLGDEVARIDRIVSQLLKFARPAKPSLLPVNVHHILDNTINLVKQQLKQNNISLDRQFHASPEYILGDSDMLVQALLNFFLNAIDAMEHGGEMIVRTRIIQEPTFQLDLWGQPITTPRMQVSIIDNGRGISPEDLPHVFDPFFTTKSTGTGLGMSVSHGIIQEHHGVIDVESELGKGTSLHLIFPLQMEEARV